MNTNSATKPARKELRIKGYIENRIAKGEVRTYGYPESLLLDLKDASFPELESSFVTAQKLKTQKGAS